MRKAIEDELKQPQPLFIDGKAYVPNHGELIDVVNPATESILCQVHAATENEVNLAVQAARRAFEDSTWKGMNPSAREKILLRIADLLEQNAERLGTIETLNNGKTIREGIGDVEPSADAFRYYAGWTRKIYGETIPVDGGNFVYTLKEPVGVCGQIVPWNYPLLMAAWKVAPALACGCTIVLKPSEWTPLTALELAKITKEAGLPDGVLNVVPGYGSVAGEALSRHMDVDKIAFTGSIRTARLLLKASAESNLKKVSLELGGKSPLLVFDDADIDGAVQAAMAGSFANKGEVCSASTRLLVQSSIKDKLLDKLTSRCEQMKVGDPFDTNNHMGALVSKAQYEKVRSYIEKGKTEGARLITSEAKQNSMPDKGYYLRPAIFDEVKSHMSIAQEEIFGPVLSVLEFADEAAAIQIANGTSYGLVSAIFTKDISRAHRLAKEIKAGVVWINRWNGFDSAAPFGGNKQSGWGRELGKNALDLYTTDKCVWVNI
ncbi:MAG: aldehyde dehydrogenase family protein [Myxococcales bacterium]|nr:MAG: aldehyde dehydrogenase family protein [Myxococcales bacterium]